MMTGALDALKDAYIPEAHQPRVRQAVEQAIRARITFDREHRVIRMDGTVGHVHSRAVPFTNRQGEIVEWFGTASDSTTIKRASRKDACARRGDITPAKADISARLE